MTSPCCCCCSCWAAPLALAGRRLFSALYVNELLVRLLHHTSVLRPYASAAFKGSALNQTKLGLRLDTAIGRLELLHSLRLAQSATDDEHSLELHATFQF